MTPRHPSFFLVDTLCPEKNKKRATNWQILTEASLVKIGNQYQKKRFPLTSYVLLYLQGLISKCTKNISGMCQDIIFGKISRYLEGYCNVSLAMTFLQVLKIFITKFFTRCTISLARDQVWSNQCWFSQPTDYFPLVNQKNSEQTSGTCTQLTHWANRFDPYTSCSSQKAGTKSSLHITN